MPSSTTSRSSNAMSASAGGASSSSSSSWEECGFVTHVVLVLLTAVYCSCLSTIVFSPDDDHSNELNEKSRQLLQESSSFWISRETCHAIHSKWSVRIPLALTIAFWMAPVLYFFLNQSHATRLWKNQSFQICKTRSKAKNQRDTTTASVDSSSIPPIRQMDLAIINSEIEKRLSTGSASS